ILNLDIEDNLKTRS
ncbi:Hypothetical predicted protein, partial [Cloeon dipterum]